MSMTIRQLVAPAKGSMTAAAVLSGLSAVLRIVPYVALTEIAVAWAAGSPGQVMWRWLAVGVAAEIVRQALYMFGVGMTHVAEARLRTQLRSRLVDALGRMPLGRVAQTSSGRIRKIVVDDTGTIHVLVAHLSGDAVSMIIGLIAGVGYLFWVNWGLALAVLLVWLLCLVVVFGLGMSGMGGLTERFSAVQAQLSSATVELVEGIKEVKSFQGARSVQSRFDDARAEFTETSYEWMSRSGRAMAVLQALFQPAAVFATVVPIAVLFLSLGWIDAPHVLPFLILTLGIPSGLLALAGIGQQLQESIRAAKDTAALLSIPPMPHGAFTDGDGPTPGSIAFEDVTFGYDPEEPVVRGMSFEAAAGTVTALVGPSGSGKTTVARLIARFFDVDSGAVRVGGVDVRDTTADWLLSRIAVVFQDVALSHDTIAANIALGRPDASREEIEEAARQACIHDRIGRLPHGYDTVVGEDDGFLSGGERQRITIARAYLQDAPILILDEATAQLDPEAENEIHRALTALCAGRTVVVVAHRLQTIASADQILVIDDGRIAERGTHEQLLAAAGIYAGLWAAQTKNAEVA
ncbi:ABC transporter ATP-binding protein [Microbacterium sp. No. 7]|uniref:ABC transporter ATP-binding protein n=1 Tax=Microbacterium sp. No. 7 TaxID=1714373 RepID=UPI0006CF6AC1|nr:ABC transporter ATP-binding protein [Microbacterium sp. No. 7]ALJ19697.1 ABC transporter ATP-binding protein [Microbacterium sp. No. 7]